MQRLGYPRPLFFLQDRLAKALAAKYKAIARKLMERVKAGFAASGVVADAAPKDDSPESVAEFFDGLSKKAAEESLEIANKANAGAAARALEAEWLGGPQTQEELLDDAINGGFKKVLDKIFKREQGDFVKRLFADADDKTKSVLTKFSIDKNKFFEDNLEAVRELYVNNALERVGGEINWIKREILKDITDYAEGRSDELDLSGLTKIAFEKGDHMARLFARDQMQRFNKACALATFKSAGVTKVKWATANDGRVRNKATVDKQGRLHRAHTELQGMVFGIDELPIEIDDYNCRCALIPVEWGRE